MAITDYSPLSANLRKAVGRFLGDAVRAFLPRPRPQIYTEDDLQATLADAMVRFQAQSTGAQPPSVPGAGWNYPPLLRTDEEQSELWGSEEAKYGRFTTQSGPSPQAYATSIADLSIERIASWHWMQVQQGVCMYKADLDAGTMREDGHLQASQRSITSLAYKSPLQFKPRNDTPLAAAVCSFVQTALEKCSTLLKAQETLFGSAGTGHAGLEVVWQTPRPITFAVNKALITAQGAQGVASLEEVHNRNFRIDAPRRQLLLDAGGNRYVDPFITPSGYPTRKLIYHNGYGTGDPHQHGYQYSSNPLCLFKKMGLGRFMVALELWGVQSPYMQYDEDRYADGQDVSAAQRFLSAIGLGKPAVLNRKFGEVKVTPPATGLDARGMHFALFGLINAEISKLAAGQTLAMEIGGTGSYGAADVHADSKEDVARIHDKLLCTTLETQLVQWIIEENIDSLCACLGATPDQILACTPIVFRMLDRRVDPPTRLKMFIDAKKELGIVADPDQVAEECAFRVVRIEEPQPAPAPPGAPAAPGQPPGEPRQPDQAQPSAPPQSQPRAQAASNWDEKQHPRRDDGKFGEGGGGEPAPAPPKKGGKKGGKGGGDRKPAAPAAPLWASRGGPPENASDAELHSYYEKDIREAHEDALESIEDTLDMLRNQGDRSPLVHETAYSLVARLDQLSRVTEADLKQRAVWAVAGHRILEGAKDGIAPGKRGVDYRVDPGVHPRHYGEAEEAAAQVFKALDIRAGGAAQKSTLDLYQSQRFTTREPFKQLAGKVSSSGVPYDDAHGVALVPYQGRHYLAVPTDERHTGARWTLYHELGHAAHNGSAWIDRDAHELYTQASLTGTWPTAYAKSNHLELWAELTSSWHHDDADSKEGRGRKWVEANFPAAATVLRRYYGA